MSTKSFGRFRFLAKRSHVRTRVANLSGLSQAIRSIVSGPRFERALGIAGTATMVVAPVVLLSLIAGAILYVRLLHGPVSLKAFSARIEQGIGAGLGQFNARIDDAVVALAPGRGIELQLINLRISEPDGDPVASAPLAAVELDHLSLLMLRPVPERVFLIEPRLSLLYSEAGGLALSFSDTAQAGERPAEGEVLQAPAGAPAGIPASTPAETVREKRGAPASFKIDLARMLAEGAARARSGSDATSSLREIGLRDATLVVDYLGATSEWKIAEAAIGLEHKKRRSIISGTARVASSRGPWSLAFRTEDSEKRNLVTVAVSVRDLVPRTFVQAAPKLSLLEPFDLPLAGDLALDLSMSGDVKGATLVVDLGQGRIDLPALSHAPLTLDAGHLRMVYDAAAHRVSVEPSTLAWGDSHVTVEGEMASEAGRSGAPEWRFSLRSTDGLLAAEEFGVAGIAVDSCVASGRVAPEEGRVELAEVLLKAGGAAIAANGEIVTGAGQSSTRLEAAMSPMTLETLKALWPRAVAPGARTWVGRHVRAGKLQSGTLTLLSGRFLKASERPPDGTDQRLSMTIQAGDLGMVPLPDGLPLEAPHALIRLENNSLEVTVPEAAMVAGPSMKVPLKSGRFAVADVGAPVPVGELSFRAQSTLAALLTAASRSPNVTVPVGDLPTDAIEGNVAGDFKITMPLAPSLDPTPPKIAGKARITDIRAKQRIGALEVQGGTIDVDVSETGATASGEMLVNGVLAKLEVQRIVDVPADMQPPLRLSATLDNADRNQLGLDVNHLVQGEVPLEITVAAGDRGEARVHARADLTNAELAIHDLAWRKVQGRTAFLDLDVGKKRDDKLDLKNFKIAGDDVAIEGWMTLDATNEVDQFHFPNFSLNLVSRLEVQGRLSPSKIWEIKARGSVYDGRDLFRSLLALGRASDSEIKPRRPSAGLDLSAEIDTVLGHSEVSARGFKLKYSERADRLVALEAQGTLEGGKPVSAVLNKQGSESRVVYAESPDAGQAFKLVGFYPNIQGGHVRLELNLDGKGAADKDGVLWVESFRVLGDPVVSEVYSSAAKSGPAIDGTPQGQRKVVREVFEFDRMKVPFSVGHGQFVIEDSYVKGPIVGASIRGKVDYNAQRVNLGGTYVPLQGISSAFCEIPLFGPIVAGPGCEGIFGLTYAIQGPMANPQVIVNPLSFLTPGIFRGLMEMTSPNPKVLPRDASQKGATGQGGTRASSSPAMGGNGAQKGEAGRPVQADAIDGWSSEGTTAGTGKN